MVSRTAPSTVGCRRSNGPGMNNNIGAMTKNKKKTSSPILARHVNTLVVAVILFSLLQLDGLVLELSNTCHPNKTFLFGALEDPQVPRRRHQDPKYRISGTVGATPHGSRDMIPRSRASVKWNHENFRGATIFATAFTNRTGHSF